MIQIILIIFLGFFVAIAPMKVTLLGLFAIGIITAIVQVTSNMIGGTKFTIGESFKAVAWSVLFMAAGIFTAISLMHGSGPNDSAQRALIAGILPYIGYTLGFRLALGVTFLHAAAIAIVSTALSIVFFWIYFSLLSKVAA